MKKRIAIVIGVLAVAFALMLWFQSSAPISNPKATLPDGTIVTVESVTYGSQHEFVFGQSNWRTRLRRALPRFLRRVVGGGRGSTMTSTGPNGLVLWVSQFNPVTGMYLNPGSTYNLDVVDEHGCATIISGWGSSGGPRGFLINSFALESFPRRAATFQFRIKARPPGSAVLAELTVPNPSRGSFPAWKPQPLPQTRTNGELTIVLKRMRTGGSAEFPWFAPDIEKTKQGRPAHDWSSTLVSLHDATGNSHPTRLCTNEPAWKLEMEFYRNEKARFAAREVWALTNLPAPTTQQLHTLNVTGVVNGIRFELFSIAGPGSFIFSNGVPVPPQSVVVTGSSSTYSSSDMDGTARAQSATVSGKTIHQLDITRKGSWLMGRVGDFKEGSRFLLRGRDERGRTFSTEAVSQIQDYRIVPLAIPEGAQRIDLEFIVHDTRKEEFLVKPPSRQPDYNSFNGSARATGISRRHWLRFVIVYENARIPPRGTLRTLERLRLQAQAKHFQSRGSQDQLD